MASNILENNNFGGPTYFVRRWATCLGSRQEGRTGLAKQQGKRVARCSVKVAHIYAVLRYTFIGTCINQLIVTLDPKSIGSRGMKIRAGNGTEGYGKL